MESLGNLFRLYVFTPGRIIFAANQTKKAAEALGNQAVASACAPAIAAARAALSARDAWSRTKTEPTARGGGMALVLDRNVDRTVSGIQRCAVNYIESFDPSHEAAVTAKEFIRKAFPEGAEAVTKLVHEEELAQVKKLRTRFDDPKDLEPYIESLKLELHIETLDKLIPEFENALSDQKKGEITYDKVEAAGADAQEKLCQLVAKIVGEYNLSSPEHVRARTALLEPIMDQNTRIGRSRRRRRSATDVDPNTGEEKVPVATPAAPAAPAAAPSDAEGKA